jgi:proteic killer suppression protein
MNAGATCRIAGAAAIAMMISGAKPIRIGGATEGGLIARTKVSRIWGRLVATFRCTTPRDEAVADDYCPAEQLNVSEGIVPRNVMRYGWLVIVSFRSAEAARVWSGQISRRLPRDIQAGALRKLRLLNAARMLSDLRVPPGNRLEALTGNRAGQHSIRINDQWRICFRWTDGGPADVEIVDYH